MNIHKNARLTFLRRLDMVVCPTSHALSLAATADRLGVTAATARKWMGLVLLLETICREELKNGLLRQVLPQWAERQAKYKLPSWYEGVCCTAGQALVDFLFAHTRRAP